MIGITLIILPLLFLSIQSAFKHAQITATENQLQANLYTVIGEMEYEGGHVTLSPTFLPPEFSQLSSGIMAVISDGSVLLWRSDSSLNESFTPYSISLMSGEKRFYQQNNLWILEYGLIFDTEAGGKKLYIQLAMSDRVIADKLREFRQTLIIWFLFIALTLISILSWNLWFTLRPIRQLDVQVKQVEAGEADRIDGTFPAELQTLKEDLNLLLDQQERQRTKYRGYLSDLAHALKTPVAVLKTSPLATDKEMNNQLDRITNIIEHQLKRAATAGADHWKKQLLVYPVLTQITVAMEKIHHVKAPSLSINCDESSFFLGDQEDFMELAGNLIDNACKACRSNVSISISNHSDVRYLTMIIDDDGPGIAENKRDALLTRGMRLDTYTEGHGVGLAIVNDIVHSYNASLEIGRSPLGGARFSLSFNR